MTLTLDEQLILLLKYTKTLEVGNELLLAKVDRLSLEVVRFAELAESQARIIQVQLSELQDFRDAVKDLEHNNEGLRIERNELREELREANKDTSHDI